MTSSGKRFLHSVQPFVGSVIGVGIFGLPFVFSQAGFGIGIVHLVVIAAVYSVVLLAYADIVMNTRGNPRFVGIVRKYLGYKWSWIAVLLMIGAIWGALLAYILIGGEFLHALLSSATGGSLFTFQIVFFVICAGLLIGGLGFIARLEVVFVFALLALLLLIMIGSLPHANFSNLGSIDPKQWFLPFGVVLFALGGISVIPEMAQILGRDRRSLRKAVAFGLATVTAVYALFAASVVSVTGADTSQEAMIGLGHAVGPWAMTIGAIIGLFSVFTSFLILGISLMDMLMYDYKRRYITSWVAAISVPLVIFLLGAREFIGVVGFIGGVFGSLSGLLLIITYQKAKKHACTTKRCLAIPNWLMFLCALVFIFGALMTIFS